MKRKYTIAISLLIGIFIIQSCYYDNPPERAPIDPDIVSFEGHILPILQNSCSITNCHDGTYVPNLQAENAWRELHSGGFVNIIFPEESIIFRSVEYLENPMPPGGPQLTPLERDLIYIWIEKGAPND